MEQMDKELEELLKRVNGGALLEKLPAAELEALAKASDLEESKAILLRCGMNLSEVNELLSSYNKIKCTLNTCPEALR